MGRPSQTAGLPAPVPAVELAWSGYRVHVAAPAPEPYPDDLFEPLHTIGGINREGPHWWKPRGT